MLASDCVGRQCVVCYIALLKRWRYEASAECYLRSDRSESISLFKLRPSVLQHGQSGTEVTVGSRYKSLSPFPRSSHFRLRLVFT